MTIEEIENEKAVDSKDEYSPQLQNLPSSCKDITCMLCSIQWAAAPT